jgi:hypothetical protein
MQRGFTLLISIILASVVLALGTALLDISYKQIVLASSAKQSGYAFYTADSALECALYWDQQKNVFDFSNATPASSITCGGQTMNFSGGGNTTYVVGTVRTTKLTVTCPSGGSDGIITATKDSGGNTALYATGYNDCNALNPNRIERGLKATYGGVVGSGIPFVPPPPPPSSTRKFTISPAVSGKSTWDLDSDGALMLASAGTWTLTPASTFAVTTKEWGAGGGGGQFSTNGAGGYAGGSVTLTSGVSYTLTVGSTAGAPGGGAAGTGHGGGYSVLRTTSGTMTLIAGGGGGGGFGGDGGAGGGTTGQMGTAFDPRHPGTPGQGGTSSSGGSGGDGSGGSGSSLQGGAGGSTGGSYPGGGGGGGYFGGGGGGYPGGSGAGGGGGGSSFADPSTVSGATLTVGNYTTPGNSADSERGTAGNPGADGAIRLDP